MIEIFLCVCWLCLAALGPLGTSRYYRDLLITEQTCVCWAGSAALQIYYNYHRCTWISLGPRGSGFREKLPCVCNSEFLTGWGNLSRWFGILPICTLSCCSSLILAGLTVVSIVFAFQSKLLPLLNSLPLLVLGSESACAHKIESTGSSGFWINVCSPNGCANFRCAGVGCYWKSSKFLWRTRECHVKEGRLHLCQLCFSLLVKMISSSSFWIYIMSTLGLYPALYPV